VTTTVELSTVERAAGVLANLSGMTPKRLRELLDRPGGPRAALDAQVRAHAVDEAAVAALLARRATRVYVDGEAGYPIDDTIEDRPPALLAEGDVPEVFDRPRVAIVGTRSCTPHGRRDAHDLGAFLAQAGIAVVSGLAIGIDGAAHEGALANGSGGSAGGAIGVVATGLDIVYPRRHVTLFERVRTAGLLVSETGFGVGPHAGRFPVRNRIIAALADVTVVIEATLTGGARITADRALDYGRPVLAVPGSRRNPAAAGCNALLADGAHPLLDPDDVLIALGMSPGGRRGWGAPPPRPVPIGDPAAVLRAFGGEPATTDQLASRTALPPDRVGLALRDLSKAGHVERSDGFWWPR